MTIVVIISYRFVPRVFRSTIVTPETIIKSFLFIPCYASNERIFPIYSVAWTITLEMFFYIIFSTCIQISHKFRGILVILGIAGLVLIGIIFPAENAIFKFWTNNYLIDFAIGILIFYLFSKKFCIKDWLANGLLIIEIFLLFIGRYIVPSQLYSPWNKTVCALLLITGLGHQGKIHIKALVKLGNMSYSLYMIHFLIIGVACRLLMDNTVLCVKNTMIVIGGILGAIFVSYIVYRVMEVWLVKKLKSFQKIV